MSEKNPYYNNTLGVPVVSKPEIATFQYCASALKEMRVLLKNINQATTQNKLIFQTLPKHMRRRAMSHHPKRLPRQYRLAHIAQIEKSGKMNITKRPSRKYRRRSRNLLQAYLRRQRKNKWLETHIWHAKRFHMVEKWGYRLPYASYDKTFRACYRATTEHCLIQDISFFACIEINASVNDIKQGFSRLSNPSCGLSITAKTFLNGRREGCIDLYKNQKYPYNNLGKINFMWRPTNDNDDISSVRTLWLWLHPIAYNCVLEELIKVFELKSQRITKISVECSSDIEDNKEDNNSGNKEETWTPMKKRRRLQFVTKILARENIPTYKNDLQTIQIRELKNTLNRFRLTGSLSHSILQHTFKVIDINSTNYKDKWIDNCLKNEIFKVACERQREFWNACNTTVSPADLMSNMILALNIEDPRLHRPKIRTKAMKNCLNVPNQFTSVPDYNMFTDYAFDLCHSSLWEQKIRDKVSNDMLSTFDYCSLRQRHAIVPGLKCSEENDLQPIPVLLIQRPGSQNNFRRLSYGCGWDIIFPAGYGMPIWLSLIMWGGRPGGLREIDTVTREMGNEIHLPDSIPGLQMYGDRYAELQAKYFRLPPNKRCNYHKLSIVSPFRIPFLQLIRDWNQQNVVEMNSKISNNFYILRDHHLLETISECIKKGNISKLPDTLPTDCIIPLIVTIKSRGTLTDFSIMCLPKKCDIKHYRKNIMIHSNEPVFVEPLIKDPHSKERKLIRLQHKKLLKRLRAIRVRKKRKEQETSTRKVFISPANTAEICAQQFKKMCRLWISEDVSTLFTVRKQGTRDCFGYITNGYYCLTEGIFAGFGYATLEGIKELLQIRKKCNLKESLCLVRSTNSRHYRLATIKINMKP